MKEEKKIMPIMFAEYTAAKSSKIDNKYIIHNTAGRPEWTMFAYIALAE